MERVARESYGLLIAWLASRCGDIAAAEDALGDALVSALLKWPVEGVPDKPERWLLVVARRRLVDLQRRQSTRSAAVAELTHRAELRASLEGAVRDEGSLPDRRLELLFACAHPEIAPAMRTPLMLQCVLGLTAEQIAALMLLPPSTVAKRLVRQKAKVFGSLSFEIPPPSELVGRLEYVLDAVYATYGAGWGSASDLGESRHGLRSEAMWLASLLVQLMPDRAEVLGLYALLCFCESRRGAGRSPEGAYIPLEEQDPSRWNHALITEGEKALYRAARLANPGPYQTEAALQSVHAQRARTGFTHWEAIHQTYAVLVQQTNAIGARIGYAASLGRVQRASDGLGVLDGLEDKATRRHQPYWAVRAWLLGQVGEHERSKAAYSRAMGLCEDAAVRRWLLERSSEGTLRTK